MKDGYICDICGGIFPINEIYKVEHKEEFLQTKKGVKTYCYKCFNKYDIADTAYRILRKDG